MLLGIDLGTDSAKALLLVIEFLKSSLDSGC